MSVTIGVMPKSTRNPYFEECFRGAQEAAQDLEFTLRWDGPLDVDPARQVQIIEQWTRDGLAAIAVSVEDPALVSPALKGARGAGVKVLTWDADAEPDARDFAIVHATPEVIARALTAEVARILRGQQGSIAGITSTFSAPNESAWINAFKTRLSQEYPGLKLVEVRACDDVAETAGRETKELLKAHPGIKAIVGFCSPAVPGAAEALKQAGRPDVRLTGVSLPSLCRGDMEAGIVDSVVIWKVRDLGYLAAAAAHAVATGTLRPGEVALRAGRLGNLIVNEAEIHLGRCHVVTKDNMAKFA